MSARKENRELVNIANTANAALRKKASQVKMPTRPPPKPPAQKQPFLTSRYQPEKEKKTSIVVNPHGDAHAASIYLGSKPSDVPSALAHGLAVHHAIPDQPSGAVRNPKRDHDAYDIVQTIESAFNVVPDAGGALELNIFPTLHDLFVPTKGKVFVSGAYVDCTGQKGFGNETEANKLQALVSSICCEAIEVTTSYVGNIEGISGELSAGAFPAGSSQLFTDVPRPADLQTMMSFPGSKTCEATQSLHINLPHSEFSSAPTWGTSGLIATTPSDPYDGDNHCWSSCEHMPSKMTAPIGSAPFAPAEASYFTDTGCNNIMAAAPTVPINEPIVLADYSELTPVYPPAKLDVLPMIRIVGGNLTNGTNGSWLVKIKALYTGTALTHVGEEYHGASANISHSVTTNAPRDSTFAKTSRILTKVGAGAATSDISTSDKAASVASTIAAGAAKVGSYLWNTLGGWSGISSKLATAGEMAAGFLL